MDNFIAGASGKSGGGSSYTEAPEALRSKGMAKVLDLIGEGEIGGLVNGLQSVYLDGTPIQNPDGTFNFDDQGFTVDYGATGTPTQAYYPNYSAVESEVVVGVLIKSGDNHAVIRQIDDETLDAVRVRVSTPALYKQNTSSGAVEKAKVEFGIDIKADALNPSSTFRPLKLSTGDIAGGVISPDKSQVDFGTSDNGKGSILFGFLLPNHDVAVGHGINATLKSYGTVTVVFDLKIGNGSWNQILGPITVRSSDAYTAGDNYKKTSPPPAPYNCTKNIDFVGLSTTQNNSIRVRITETSPANWSAAMVGAISSTIRVSGTTGSSLTSFIEDNHRSKYEKTFKLRLTGKAPWQIKITRLTPDSDSATIQDLLYWESYTEIIEHKFNYPNSAVIGITASAEFFKSIPQRGYRCKLLLIKVPSNYYQENRYEGCPRPVYDGSWDGTWKTVWSNNPAWCTYDLITAERYGLGRYIPELALDKWEFYQIGRYCDAVDANGMFVGVPDGFGRLEPRFTLNTYIQTRVEAFKVLTDLAGVFRGMLYIGAGAIIPTQDSPCNASMPFSPANVVDGLFTYNGTARKARHTVAAVAWNDPTDLYRQKVELVESDPIAVGRYGYNKIDITAFGCSSRAQAHRVGKWLLHTEINETETLTFKTGLDGTFLRPGSVISVADPERMNFKRFGGRVVNATTFTTTLDAPVPIDAGQQYTLTVILPDGTLGESTFIGGGEGTLTTIPTAFDLIPEKDASWQLSVSTNQPSLWRVVSIVEVDKGVLEITGLMYNPSKYGYVEQDLTLELPQEPTVDLAQALPPANLKLTQDKFIDGLGVSSLQLSVTWDAPSAYIIEYECSYRRVGDTLWQVVPGTGTSRTIPVMDGAYDVRVRSKNALNRWSGYALEGVTITNIRTVPNVTGLEIVGQGNNSEFLGPDVVVGWNRLTTDPPVQAGSAASLSRPQGWFSCYIVKVFDINGNLRRSETTTKEQYVYTHAMNHQDGITRNLTFYVYAVATWGDKSETPAILDVSNPAPVAVGTVTLTPFIKGLAVTFEPLSATEIDLEGYLIYADEDPNFDPSETTLVNRGPETSKFLADLAGGPWTVIVAAYDKFGEDELNYSARYSATVPTLDPLDTVPPAVPTGLVLATEYLTASQAPEASITASWTNPPDEDFSNAMVRIKKTTDLTWAEYPATQQATKYVFKGLTPGVSYDVAMAAVDKWSNISAYGATGTIVAAINNTKPLIIDPGYTLAFSFKNMYLNWAPAPEGDIQYYEVAVAPDNTFTTGVVSNTVPFGTNIVSFPVSPAVPYYVRLRAVNYSGTQGDWSVVKSGSTDKIGATDVTVTGELITVSAQIRSLIVTSGHIVSLAASKITTGALGASESIYLGTMQGNGQYPVHMSSAVGGLSRIKFNDGTWDRIQLGQLPTGVFGFQVLDASGNQVLRVDNTGAALQNLTSGNIDANLVTINNLVVGGNVTMGPSARIDWSKVDSRPNTTHIDINGVYTGTVVASQLIARGDLANLVYTSYFTSVAKGRWSTAYGVENFNGLGTPPRPYWLVTNVRDTLADDDFPATPGEVFAASAWIETGSTTHPCSFGIMWKDAAGGIITWSAVATKPAGQAWALVKGSVVAPDGAAFGQPWCQINGVSSFGYARFSDMVITRQGVVLADQIIAGTITGSTLQTDVAGQKRTVISSVDDSMRMYGDRGDGVINEILCANGTPTNIYGTDPIMTLGNTLTARTGLAIINRAGIGATGIPFWINTDTPMWAAHIENVGYSSLCFGLRAYVPNAQSTYTVYGSNNSAAGSLGCANAGLWGAGVYGAKGDGSSYDFYAVGNTGGNSSYGPFTGAHDALLDLGTEVEVGDIVTDAAILIHRGVSNTLAKVMLSSEVMQPTVIGVVVTKLPYTSDHIPTAAMGDQDYIRLITEYDQAIINAVGEGQVNVCKDGGDIQAGDYICSSGRLGKGMKQPDGLLHNYTVAKAREACIWAEGDDSIRMIACTYHCG